LAKTEEESDEEDTSEIKENPSQALTEEVEKETEVSIPTVTLTNDGWTTPTQNQSEKSESESQDSENESLDNLYNAAGSAGLVSEVSDLDESEDNSEVQ